MEQLTLRDLIGYWEFHNRTEGKSPNTIRWYSYELGKFEHFLVREGSSTLIAEIGEPQVRAYIAYLQQKRKWDDTDHCPTAEEGLSPGGIQNRIRALKAFFNWLHREGYTETYRLERLANYRVPSRVVDVLTEAEIGRVLAACDTKSDWGARAYAILTLMLDSGLRISEVAGLRTAELELDAGWLKVLGKGGKERIVPFGTATQRALWRYQHHYRPEPLGPDQGIAVRSPANTPGLVSDCAILLEAKATLGEAAAGWSADRRVATWEGVEVSGGRVRAIGLWGSGLDGSIPAELGSLSGLEELLLVSGQLTGSIPPELGGLPRLEILSLYGNQLTGSIPPELGNLFQLRFLTLYGNQLRGASLRSWGICPSWSSCGFTTTG